MTSIQDIMSFLTADKEARARENQEDKEERAKQRVEDLKQIEMMINNGVQEEVQAALKPFQERIDQQDRVVEDMTKQLSSIMMEMNILKNSAAKGYQEDFPALHQKSPGPTVHQEAGAGAGWPGGKDGEGVQGGDGWGHSDALNQTIKVCAAARKVVGLTPIEPRMLDIQMQSYGAKNVQEAMMMEVQSYLKCEMKMEPSVIGKLNIVNVFHPAKDDWNTLYIELGSDQEVDTLYTYTRNIKKKDHRVFPYIPKELYRRYRAAETFLYNVRHEDKVKTKVKIGLDDLVLLIKSPGSTYWRKCPIPGSLPSIEIGPITEPLSFLKKNLVV